jgi:hypothetical protein
MKFNPLTSKTIFGAVVVAIGIIGDSGVLGKDNAPLVHAIASLVEAIGGVVFAWGMRHAIAKAAEGISQ